MQDGAGCEETGIARSGSGGAEAMRRIRNRANTRNITMDVNWLSIVMFGAIRTDCGKVWKTLAREEASCGAAGCKTDAARLLVSTKMAVHTV